MNWIDRLAQGRPPLRIGEFCAMLGISDETARKMIKAKAVKAKALIDGGEERIPAPEARRLAIEHGVIEAA